MLGIICILILSWIILKIFNFDFNVFGFKPSYARIKDLGIGFLVAALSCFIYFTSFILLLDYSVELNSDFQFSNFLSGAWWALKSVITEELLFRGALLVIAIKYVGEIKACLLSAIIFGIYHWFSYNVFGNLLPMLNTFIITGMGGLMFAYAYVKTRSLYLPVALHFGWNVVTITIFSEGPLGDQLLITSGGKPMGYLYFASLLYQILLLPCFTYWYLKKHKNDLITFRAPAGTRRIE